MSDAPCSCCEGRKHVVLLRPDGQGEHIWCWHCVTPSWATRKAYDGPVEDEPGPNWLDLTGSTNPAP